MAGFSQKSKSKFSQLMKTRSESCNHGTKVKADKFTTLVSFDLDPASVGR